MRIVRFIESWQERFSLEEQTVRWGLLVDHFVFPLEQAPYA